MSTKNFRLRNLTSLFFFLFFFVSTMSAQNSAPEMSVAGLEIGNSVKNKAFLSTYSPRKDEDGRPNFYFYNKFGTQVMKLTAESFENPYFITEIEVFKVDESYQKKHFIAEKVGFFVTESGIFIGYRQSTVSFLVGIPNVGREDMIGPKDVIKKKGIPFERVKSEKKEVIIYQIANVKLSEQSENIHDFTNYFARYEFYKNRLQRFSLKIFKNKNVFVKGN